MAGYMYLGSQKVCPAVLMGGGESDIIPQTVEDGAYKGISLTEFKLPDDAVTIDSNTQNVLKACFIFNNSYSEGPAWTQTINFNNLQSVYGPNSFYDMCTYSSSVTSVTAPELEYINAESAFYRAFFTCPNITSCSFPKLKEIRGSYACHSMFTGCESLDTVDFSSLEVIGEDPQDPSYLAAAALLLGTKVETIRFPSLKYIYPYQACWRMFMNCYSLKDVYFNSLRSDAFGTEYNNQFLALVQNTTGVKLHFPSNLSSVIPTLSNYPDFNGTNTVILYDLPATE